MRETWEVSEIRVGSGEAPELARTLDQWKGDGVSFTYRVMSDSFTIRLAPDQFRLSECPVSGPHELAKGWLLHAWMQAIRKLVKADDGLTWQCVDEHGKVIDQTREAV